MSRLTLLGLASLALVPLTAVAQERPNLERRLADLERQLEASLKEVKDLRAELKARAEGDFEIYRLKNVPAEGLAQTLHKLLGDDGKSLRIVAEPTSNSLLVRAKPDQANILKAIIQRLDVPAEGGDAKPNAAPKEVGTLTEKLEKAIARLGQVESDLEQLRDRAAWSDRMARKQFISAAQAQAERARLKSAETARSKLLDDLIAIVTEAKPKP